MKYKFKMAEDGKFRIGVNGQWSEWTLYSLIAYLRIGDDTYIGVSAYYSPAIPCEVVLKVTALPTDSKELCARICQSCNGTGTVLPQRQGTSLRDDDRVLCSACKLR